MIQFLCASYFKLTGWKIEGVIPENIKQCVVIAVPHTSNYDFPLTIGFFSLMKKPIRYLGKKELFSFPLGIIMRATGGIAVDRSKKNNLVEYMVSLFQEYEELALVIPPEGTRSKVEEWKSGFYHVAVQAKLPIALGYLDYERKVGGVLDMFYPTGNLKEDLPKIKAYYTNIKGKHTDKF
jgi:1-acyl-sn-glycerol-3-phosphate acyltransferase